MSAEPSPEKRIFNEALALPASGRAAFLDRACVGDAALRKSLEELLQSHEEASRFLESPHAQSSPPQTSDTVLVDSEKVGDSIGHYKLLEQIGEGGCGVVYMAEQREPVRRQVALKLIKPGMDTKSVIARFEAERQALALMDHPNIAKVLDAGATKTGRPYFVMELVRGTRITHYCDQHQSSTEERLKLFIQVCEAIHHAHQKGIIHRDIKPSNVLVTSLDGVATPKVIDFGIAKATTGQRLTDKTLFTAFEHFMGTPAYMSPEQTTMNDLGIDTRSDIYSLGILLYELLTGTPPFETKELLAAGLDAMRQIIQHKEPLRPSSRLSTMALAQLTATASQRQTQPPKLIHLIRGDLDWIVMKSLEKDRRRRYESASGLKADVQRFLNHDPVTARPPSVVYQLQKTIQRNRLLFGSAAAIAVALIAGLGFSLWSLVQEKAARRRAVEAEHAEILLRQKSETSEKDAKVEAAKSRQVAQFLENMLGSIDPAVAMGRDSSFLKEILDKTSRRVGQDLTNQPAVEAELRHTLGETYWALGDLDHAGDMHQKALDLQRKIPGDDAQGASSLNDLAMVFWRKGSVTNAEAMLREALVIQRKLPANNLEVAKTLNNLAGVLNTKGSTVEALEALREALAIEKAGGASQPEVADTLTSLAAVLTRRKAFTEAESNVCEALSIQTNVLGNVHPAVANSLNVLAMIKDKEGDRVQAEALYRQTLALRKKLYGDEHLQVALSYYNLGRWLKAQFRYAEAAESLQSALAIQKKLLGPNVETANTGSELGVSLQKTFKYAEAEAVLRENLAINIKLHGSNHLETAGSDYRLGFTLWKAGKLTEAESVIKESVRIREKLNPEHPDDANSLIVLWHICLEQNRTAESTNLILGAVKQGNAEAMNDLAYAYDWGTGFPKDEVAAAAWYQKASDGGNEWGTYNLGRLYQTGHVLPKDMTKAVQLYQKAAEATCANAIIQLGYLYQSGNGVPRDPGKAIAFFRRAIDLGNTQSLNELGWLLATWPDAAIRDGPEALKLADKAVTLSHGTNANYVDTLAAAYAEVGQFDKAITSEEKVLSLAQGTDQTNLLQGASARLELFRQKQPVHEFPAAQP